MIGNFGAAYQDFENDVAAGLEQGLRKLKTIGKLNVITLPTSLYGSLIQRKISEFCRENGYVATIKGRRREIKEIKHSL